MSHRHRRNEPISPPVHGLDELRALSRITQDAAELPNTPAHHRVADRRLAPHRVQQCILRHQLARLCDQILQHRKGLGSERKGLHTVPELPAAHLKPKGREEEYRVRIDAPRDTKILQKLHGFFTTSCSMSPILLHMRGSSKAPEENT